MVFMEHRFWCYALRLHWRMCFLWKQHKRAEIFQTVRSRHSRWHQYRPISVCIPPFNTSVILYVRSLSILKIAISFIFQHQHKLKGIRIRSKYFIRKSIGFPHPTVQFAAGFIARMQWIHRQNEYLRVKVWQWTKIAACRWWHIVQ